MQATPSFIQTEVTSNWQALTETGQTVGSVEAPGVYEQYVEPVVNTIGGAIGMAATETVREAEVVAAVVTTTVFGPNVSRLVQW
jgi:hypothetical protein